MTTKTTPPATGREAAEAAGCKHECMTCRGFDEPLVCPADDHEEACEWWTERYEHIVRRLTRERDEAIARAETAEAKTAAVTRAAEWLAERRDEYGTCSECPAYHACGPDAPARDCVERLAEALAGHICSCGRVYRVHVGRFVRAGRDFNPFVAAGEETTP